MPTVTIGRAIHSPAEPIATEKLEAVAWKRNWPSLLRTPCSLRAKRQTPQATMELFMEQLPAANGLQTKLLMRSALEKRCRKGLTNRVRVGEPCAQAALRVGTTASFSFARISTCS